jgi:hypothetical protein
VTLQKELQNTKLYVIESQLGAAADVADDTEGNDDAEDTDDNNNAEAAEAET